MTELVIDKRGHCVGCPPCTDTHDGHCPRHVYDRALTPEQKAEIDRRWNEMPDWRKQDIIDEIELGLV
jgi:Fe-S oxidoreductase